MEFVSTSPAGQLRGRLPVHFGTVMVILMSAAVSRSSAALSTCASTRGRGRSGGRSDCVTTSRACPPSVFGVFGLGFFVSCGRSDRQALLPVGCGIRPSRRRNPVGSLTRPADGPVVIVATESAVRRAPRAREGSYALGPRIGRPSAGLCCPRRARNPDGPDPRDGASAGEVAPLMITGRVKRGRSFLSTARSLIPLIASHAPGFHMYDFGFQSPTWRRPTHVTSRRSLLLPWYRAELKAYLIPSGSGKLRSAAFD